jgi:1,4-dihydroxy-2-naphthoyl-CoA synthase
LIYQLDPGWGTAYMERLIGESKAKEGVRAWNEKRKPDYGR